MTAFITTLLDGEVAVVTGAARGNGEAIARGLAQHGARVAAVDIDAAGVQAVAEAIRADGGTAEAFPLDIADFAACEALADRLAETLGPASILVNNAGVVRRVEAGADGFLGSVRDQFGINVLGTAHMVKVLLDQLRGTGGRIVNIGSIASFTATTGGIGYSASKGAVLMMTKALAAELAPMGIRANGVAPGLMITPMTAPTRANPEAAKRYLDHIPMKRFGNAEELVGPVLFLASRLSSYVTGTMLPVDGGYLTV